MMHQQKGKKIFVYLFLFIIVGSINNTSFTKNKFNNIKNIKISGLNENENLNLLENIMKLNLENIFFLNGNEISEIINSNSLVGSINNTSFIKNKFNNIKNIKISGLNENENLNLLENIMSLNLENIFFLNGNEISEIINSNSLVENYEIFKIYPNTIDIKIKKTNFLGKINRNGKFFLIGSNGKLSDIKFSDKELPFIFGKPEINEFIKFTDIIEQSKFSLSQIKNLFFFPSKRWDLELNNNIILKLSKDHTELSLNQSFEILNDNNFKDIKIVDARIKNQIILND